MYDWEEERDWIDWEEDIKWIECDLERFRFGACSVDCIEFTAVSFCFINWLFDDLSSLSPLEFPSFINKPVLFGMDIWRDACSTGITTSTFIDEFDCSFVPEPAGTEAELGVDNRRGAFGRQSSVVVR